MRASALALPARSPARTAIAAAGILLLALAWLVAVARPAAAQDTATTVAQAAPTDETEKRMRGLDPWNTKIGTVPEWDPNNAPPALRPRAKRHLEFIQAGVPVEYRSRRSPFPSAPKFIDAGGRIYRDNCLACHGAQGRGDGDAGLDLVPSPALLSRMMGVQGTVDEYLLWTISEGGKPFDTEMPAFKDRLSEDQIWQVIAYMRAGFPPATN